MMKKLTFHGMIAGLMMATLLLAGAEYARADAREAARTTLFKAADNALKAAEDAKADLYAPEAYTEAMEYYQDADKAFAKGKDLAGIENKLSRAVELFTKATEISGYASVFFDKAKTARDDAERVDALKYDYETWKEADETFKKAIVRYEDGDQDRARKDAEEAETLFRKTELETIKISYLDGVRKGVEAMKDLGNSNNAKKITEKAQKLVHKAEQELDRQRYSNENAQTLADQADYEIRHAQYVHQRVRKMKDADYSYEDVILDGERSLTRVCEELGITPRFDKGLDEVDRLIADEIKKMKFKIAQHEKNTKDLQARISGLEDQITRMMNDEEELKRQRKLAEEALKRQKMKQALKEKKLQSIRAAFAQNEGKVLMDGNNIIIRLYGLNFPSGKSEIEPKYFGLLTKVKKTFSMFKDCEVVIEGHTDALGSDAVNQRLSEDRAEAVKHYFLANAGIAESRLNAIGYGETRPVASNETEAGQAMNRRIDVVIIPSDE
jgi:outer membrane protein OmpA-like peptidoglycan-associated protein